MQTDFLFITEASNLLLLQKDWTFASIAIVFSNNTRTPCRGTCEFWAWLERYAKCLTPGMRTNLLNNATRECDAHVDRVHRRCIATRTTTWFAKQCYFLHDHRFHTREMRSQMNYTSQLRDRGDLIRNAASSFTVRRNWTNSNPISSIYHCAC